MVEQLNCDECFMLDICSEAKEHELHILRDNDLIAPRLYEYCPLKDIVRSKIGVHTQYLARIVYEYNMNFGRDKK